MIIRENVDSPRNVWPLARVTRVFPDEQNLVRKVELCKAEPNLDSKDKRTKQATYVVRPIHKLVLLLSDGDNIDNVTCGSIPDEEPSNGN